MPVRKEKKQINLLPLEEFESSIFGRVLTWAMSTFRIIVIVTEMIVMVAFLSRFWLDARNSDLNDEIKVKQTQIEAQRDFEKSFRQLTSRLKIVAELKKVVKPSEILAKITSRLPQDVHLQAYSFQESSVQMRGVAGSEASIAQFIANLEAEETFKKVSLGQVGSGGDSGLTTVFNVNLNF